METTSATADSPDMLPHLRGVARIALWAGAIAVGGLVVMLYALTDSTGTSYGELIRSHTITQHQLGPALLIGGLFLLAFTACLTWLIALYSSFRVAGPLFRLARNLEASISHGPVKPVPIRESDQLHADAKLQAESLRALAGHYHSMRDEVGAALARLEAGETTAEQRQAICARLRERLEHARF